MKPLHKIPLKERLLLQSMPVTESGCWIWMGKHNADGYGVLRNKIRVVSAHRTSYELFKGPIPDGLVIDHLCNVTLCVNPDHLEAVTDAVNLQRAKERRTTCRRGHLWDEDNTHIANDGRRYCRACERGRYYKNIDVKKARMKDYYRRNAEKVKARVREYCRERRKAQRAC